MSTASRKSLVKTEHLPNSPYLIVKVTDQMIRDAARKNSAHCMTATAVTAACEKRGINATYVSVDIQTIRFSDPARGLRYVYLTPRTAQRPIIEWDQGSVPEEFSFILSCGAVHPMNIHTAKTKKAKAVARKMKTRLAKPVMRRGTKAVPRIVGGREPPAFSTRREFGLRSFGGTAGPVRAV